MRVDYSKSSGPWIFDKDTRTRFLDLRSNYSSLPFGWNCEYLTPSIPSSYLSQRVPLYLYDIDEVDDLVSHILHINPLFSTALFLETGSLSVEAAIKLSFLDSRSQHSTSSPALVSLSNSFHGINGITSLLTDSPITAPNRIPLISANTNTYGPYTHYRLACDSLSTTLPDLVQHDHITIVLEPIQCTGGDILFNPSFLFALIEDLVKHDIPYTLIYDEIQSGSYANTTLWSYDRLQLPVPDYLVFGKRSQIYGVLSRREISPQDAKSCHTTFNGSLTDIVRSKLFFEACISLSVPSLNTNLESSFLSLQDILPQFKLSAYGVLWSITCHNQAQRDQLYNHLFSSSILTNPTVSNVLRLRPPSTLNSSDFNYFADILRTFS